MRVFVTGATGFVGRALTLTAATIVDALRNYDIVPIIDFG